MHALQRQERTVSLDAYIQACEERFTDDPAYRRRLQRELFNTDAHESIQRTLEAVRFGESIRRIA
jgi:hypothetical protein